MATELTELDLFEVSLVDAGDDPLAKVTLFKRKEKSEMEDITKTAEQWQAEVDTLSAEVETLKAKVDELETEKVEKAKAEEETIEVDGEMVAKSLIPAPILKHLETLQKEKEELQKAKEAEELRKRAEETLPNLRGTADQKAKLLKSVGDDAELLEILKASDTAFKGLLEEVGKTNSENDHKSADDKLDEMVKSYEVEKKTSYEQAYAAVIKTADGKALLREIRKQNK